jgi:hypothetical protein
MLMLTASDPAAEFRLRGFVKVYRDLAERAKKDARLVPAAARRELPQYSS